MLQETGKMERKKKTKQNSTKLKFTASTILADQSCANVI